MTLTPATCPIPHVIDINCSATQFYGHTMITGTPTRVSPTDSYPILNPHLLHPRITLIADIEYSASQSLWVYDDNRGSYPTETDRSFSQQQRLWRQDAVHFELGGTSNSAANETSKHLLHPTSFMFLYRSFFLRQCYHLTVFVFVFSVPAYSSVFPVVFRPFILTSLHIFSPLSIVTSARQNIINMVCCVGPDFVYEQGTYANVNCTYRGFYDVEV